MNLAKQERRTTINIKQIDSLTILLAKKVNIFKNSNILSRKFLKDWIDFEFS